MRNFSSQPGIIGLLLGFTAGFLMYASDASAAAAVIGLVAAGILVGVHNRHWIIEIFSLVPAMAAGSLCALTTIVWKRDPTAHNLWPLELLMVGLMAAVFLLVLAGIGRLLRRYLIDRGPEPRPAASIYHWIVPVATTAAIAGYVLVRGAMMDVR